MVRKTLIIFALIIAAFPYLGFSDTADLIVTTAFSLLIALALILGKKPKTIKQSQNINQEQYSTEDNSVRYPISQEMKISHPENEISRNVSFVSSREDTNVKINNEANILNNQSIIERQVEIPVQKTRAPRRRVVSARPTDIVQDTVMNTPIVEVKNENASVENIITIRKRQRKSSPNTILAHEDSVPPADTPVRFE